MSNLPTQADQSSRLLAALAYPIWLIIALVIVATDMKKDPFMRHHGWTALFWGIAWAIVFVALNIIGFIVPFFGGLFVFLTGWLFWLAWLILSIYYAVQTYNGKTFTIPVVSDWAKKYATQP